MDSAGVLAQELARTPDHPLDAADRVEQCQRSRVERLQASSRALARFMFVDKRPRAFLRDQLMRAYTLEMLTRSIRDHDRRTLTSTLTPLDGYPDQMAELVVRPPCRLRAAHLLVVSTAGWRRGSWW